MAAEQSQARGVPSGKGERIALGGYNPQYVAAICLVLREVRHARLKELFLADLDAGPVDDLVLVYASGAVHGFQMKAYEVDLTFNDMAGTPGLLRQLADGWQRLRAKFPGADVRVHLLTNQPFSASTHP
jgi:hypothetical protein